MLESLEYKFSGDAATGLAYKVAMTITSCASNVQLAVANKFADLAIACLEKSETKEDAEELRRLCKFLRLSKTRELSEATTLIRGNHVLH